MYILSNKEKAALITIARRTRYDYLRKNDYTYLEDDIDMIDEEILISEENIEKTVAEKVDGDVCASDFEKIFDDPYLIKISKALTKKDRLVLFSYYLEKDENGEFDEKTDKVVAKELNMKPDTARKTRKRALGKLKKEYLKLKGNDKNDVQKF